MMRVSQRLRRTAINIPGTMQSWDQLAVSDIMRLRPGTLLSNLVGMQTVQGTKLPRHCLLKVITVNPHEVDFEVMVPGRTGDTESLSLSEFKKVVEQGHMRWKPKS